MKKVASTIRAGSALHWPDGQPAGKLRRARELPLLGTHWRGRYICFLDRNYRSKSLGLCVAPLSLHVPALSPAQVHATGMSRLMFGSPRQGRVVMSQLKAMPPNLGKTARAQLGHLTSCYGQALNRRKPQAGLLSLRLTVGPQGWVNQVITSKNSVGKKIAACAISALRIARYPKTTGHLELTLLFTPLKAKKAFDPLANP